jgi:hypothetical protein
MTWNYRVIRTDEAFAIHEVFYDSNGEINGWSADPIAPMGETQDELMKDLELIQRALTLPVLKVGLVEKPTLVKDREES